MVDPDSEKWLIAMRSEIESMGDNQVWNLVDLPDGFKAIECKWIYKKKIDMDGNGHIHKARLVEKGFRQVQGVDYDETFSPVAILNLYGSFLPLLHISTMKYGRWISRRLS